MDRNGGELRKAVEEAVVLKAEGRARAVGDGPKCAGHGVVDPGDQYSVGDVFGFDTEKVIVGFGDAIELRAIAIQGCAAGAVIAGGGALDILREAA